MQMVLQRMSNTPDAICLTDRNCGLFQSAMLFWLPVAKLNLCLVEPEFQPGVDSFNVFPVFRQPNEADSMVDLRCSRVVVGYV